MVAADMAVYILSQMAGVSSAEDANERFGNSAATYIKDNAEITFSWVAALPYPPYTSDPQTQATGEIVFLEFNITPSYTNTKESAHNHLKTQLISGMMNAMYNITEAGFSTTQASMSSSPTINNLILEANGSTPMDAMTEMCQSIIDWVKQLAPVAPCAGSHGSYVGNGTVIQII